MPRLTDTQWITLSGLLDAALDLPADARAAWLADLQQRDPTMAEQVAGARAARDSEGFKDFLEGPSPAPLQELAAATLTGRHIGPYVIDTEIGRGGMGSVWRAHRADGRYEGNVAIKFVHASWIGKAGEQRFQQEGRMLGRLNHPNIARLLDAGVLEATQPYLVLEYVDGEPLDVYSERQHLTLRARIELFLKVLEAVAHAHANLIVHRDIKPGNILVASQGIVKLLDFGIAKLIDDAQTASQTQMSAIALTPRFAAPEQLLGEAVTTATDVYSLGLTLYLLLTGKLATGDTSRPRAEVINSVLTGEAPRASKVAALAGIDAKALAGDLDNILNKAMKRVPSERYASVAAFADDLRRFLANDPVSARPDTVGYRASKFVMRHRLGTALASIAFVALATSVVISAIQTRRASSAAKNAQHQRDLALAGISQAQDLTQLTSYLLGEALPDDRPELREQVLMRGVAMVRAAKSFTPGRRAQMLEVIATHFENNREYERASQLYTEAHELAVTGSDAGERASTSCHLAQMKVSQGENEEEALRTIDLALSELPADVQYAESKVICHLAKSQVLILQGRPAIAELEAAAKRFPELQVANQWLEADIVALLTAAYTDAMRVPEAVKAYQREEELLEATGSAHLRSAVVHFSNESVFFWKIGRPLDARASLERAQQIDRERGTEDVDDAVSLVVKARIASELGDAAGAVAGYERALRKARATADVPAESVAIGEQVQALVQAGDFARAEGSLPVAEQLLHERFGPDHWMFGMLRMQSALVAEHNGDGALAQRQADEAIALFGRGSGQGTYQFPIALVQRAGIEQRSAHYAAARSDAERALAIYDMHFGKDVRSVSIGDALVALGSAVKASGDAATAKERFALAALHYESSLGIAHAKSRAARAL
jgi:eukaryotic-like serine/threonine-protein kinase